MSLKEHRPPAALPTGGVVCGFHLILNRLSPFAFVSLKVVFPQKSLLYFSKFFS